MTYHTRRCEVCEQLFTFKTNKQDLTHLWRYVECRKPKAIEETNPARGNHPVYSAANQRKSWTRH